MKNKPTSVEEYNKSLNQRIEKLINFNPRINTEASKSKDFFQYDLRKGNFLNLDLVSPFYTSKNEYKLIESPELKDTDNSKPTFNEICDHFNGLAEENLEDCDNQKLASDPKYIPSILLNNPKKYTNEKISKKIKEKTGVDVKEVIEISDSEVLIKFASQKDFSSVFLHFFQKRKNDKELIKIKYDKRDSPNSNWFCVVVRGIETDKILNGKDFIDKYFTVFKKIIKKYYEPFEFKNEIAFGFEFNTFNDAFQFCLEVQNKGKYIVGFHYKSCKTDKGNRNVRNSLNCSLTNFSEQLGESFYLNNSRDESSFLSRSRIIESIDKFSGL